VRGREDALTVEDRATTKDTKEHKEAFSSQQSAKTKGAEYSPTSRAGAEIGKQNQKQKCPVSAAPLFKSVLIRVNQW
jgi:hypothetical protein